MSIALPPSFAPLAPRPVLRPPAADPWIFRHESRWYSLQAVGRTLQLRIASSLCGLDSASPHFIWEAPASGGCSRNLWAPEMHYLEGRWIIYLAADDGRNENHRMWALEGDTPLGPWKLRGKVETPGWAIDGSLLEADGTLYFAWSGWPGGCDGQQNLYLARMRDPWTLDGRGVLISQPDQPWERNGLPLCEGPQWLRRGGKTFLVYSASGSWTPDYCLGLLINDSGDLLDPRTWQKRSDPILAKTDDIWGVGHCCFAQDDHGTDLLFYHAKTSLDHGWDDRQVWAQSFLWDHQGHPTF